MATTAFDLAPDEKPTLQVPAEGVYFLGEPGNRISGKRLAPEGPLAVI